jgi:hypothetical protein
MCQSIWIDGVISLRFGHAKAGIALQTQAGAAEVVVVHDNQEHARKLQVSRSPQHNPLLHAKVYAPVRQTADGTSTTVMSVESQNRDRTLSKTTTGLVNMLIADELTAPACSAAHGVSYSVGPFDFLSG